MLPPMSLTPDPHMTPAEIDAEIAEIFAENPGLRAELDEINRQIDAGTLKTHPHSEARKIVGLDPSPSD